jgi:hypothetical protein
LSLAAASSAGSIAALSRIAAIDHTPPITDLAPDDLPGRVVEIVYADVDRVLWGAAELSVRAQLAYLRR